MNVRRMKGQGLVEYALILVLVAVVTIIILSLMGDQVTNVFCQIVKTVDDEQICGETDNLVITRSHYIKGTNTLQLDATIDGGVDPEKTVTYSVNGQSGTLSIVGTRYSTDIGGITGCPCTVTVRSKNGRASATFP